MLKALFSIKITILNKNKEEIVDATVFDTDLPLKWNSVKGLVFWQMSDSDIYTDTEEQGGRGIYHMNEFEGHSVLWSVLLHQHFHYKKIYNRVGIYQGDPSLSEEEKGAGGTDSVRG